MIVDITNATSSSVPKKKVELWLKLLEKKLPKKVLTKTLTVIFVPPARIRRLNKRYRGKDRPTDVLSFAGTYPGHLGDLVLCPQVIKKQAKEHGLTFKLELAYMLLHGVLHLLGYDHEESARAAKTMFELQDKIFESLSDKI